MRFPKSILTKSYQKQNKYVYPIEKYPDQTRFSKSQRTYLDTYIPNLNIAVQVCVMINNNVLNVETAKHANLMTRTFINRFISIKILLVTTGNVLFNETVARET
jgi:hypothetical protein